MDEAIGVHCPGRRLGVIEITEELLISARTDLAGLANGQCLVRVGVDDLALNSG
jgi:hypothetical protein